MFSRWGAFVYRRRRIVLLTMLVLAAAAAPLAAGTSDQLSAGGWLDPKSESAAVADRLEAEFGGGRTSFVALFRSDAPGADARSAEFQAAIAETVAPLRDDAQVSGDHGLCADGRRPVHQREGRRHVRRHRPRHDRRRVRGRGRRDRGPAGPAERIQRGADRLRADPEGLGRAVREGPRARRDRLAADRGPRPHPRLRLDRRGRHAAPRCRPRDPDLAGHHQPRRPPDRDEHLRPEHRDDARAGPRDRLLPLHHEPLPRGAGEGPVGRVGRDDRRRHGRQGRPLLGRRRRHRPVRPPLVRGLGAQLDRPRRCGRRPQLRDLLAHVPAGVAGDARAAGQRACPCGRSCAASA